jgi:Aspartate/tyrosine/aromatic aminotransferase
MRRPDFTNVVAFQSLSKRSNLPGMRVGFAAGDKKFLAAFLELRNIAAPQVPAALQHVAVAAYSDEAHVEENRRLYRIKFDLADQILGNRYGYVRPAGGFCVWLDVSDRGGDRSRDRRLYGCRRTRDSRKLFVAAAGRRQQSRRRLYPACAGIGQ